MSSIKFRVDCIPPKSTAQAGLRILKRRDGSQFIGRYSKSKSMQASRMLSDLFKDFIPDRPLEGPLEAKVRWIYPWRKNETKKNKLKSYKYCDTRSDIDNIFKRVGDIFTKLGFWKDDAQVAILHFEKMWADEPGIEVEITELDC